MSLTGRRARLGWSVVAVILAIAATVAALLPPRGTPGIEVADLGESLALLLHLAGFAALAFSSILAQERPRPLLTAAVLMVYAGGLQVAQGWVGLRSFQISDLVANAVGIGLGVALGIGLTARLRTRRDP
jgi:VanZ family protein